MATTLTFEGDVQVILPHAIPMPESHAGDSKLAYKIEEAAEIASISPSKLRRYILDGELEARKNGRDYIITRTALSAFINTLPLALEAAS